jgi:triacylglycerol lipase
MTVFPAHLRGLPAPTLAPLHAEARLALEVTRLLRSDAFRAPRRQGDGRGVLLLPGLLCGDWTLKPLADWLRRSGYTSADAAVRLNVNCSRVQLAHLEARLEWLADRTGGPVALIGHSRGGALARAMAVRRPRLVSGVICLGAPLKTLLNVAPWTWGTIVAIGLAGHVAPGLFSTACWQGACCEEYNAASSSRYPTDVGFVSVYSKLDGIIDWRGCLDPAAEQVEVSRSHFGMVFDAGVYELIANRLNRFARPDTPQVSPPQHRATVGEPIAA